MAAAAAFRGLLRRKPVDARNKTSGLSKQLTCLHLIGIGVGSTVGAGVYVLVGTVAREHSGPALTLSFLIAGLAAALSAFCYAELASRCPSAGSAYHYSYICVGEGVAWLIGWALILEYTIGGSAVARGISPNLASFFGGEGGLPFFLARTHIPWLDLVVDPCAALLVLAVTGLLCVGIKESSRVQACVMIANVCVMVFVVIAGGYLGFKNGWAGYERPNSYFPFGFSEVLAGSATVFFAYIGFDVVASTAEEVKNPHLDLPIGIGVALFICCVLYMLVSAVIVGLVPYYAMDPDTPISSAFATHGMQWAAYIITAGAVTALCSTLMGSLLPQPRILMAMARDGLLPKFFSHVHVRTHVPVKGTIITGICAALLSFFMDVSQLAGLVSVGTLLAFTIVAVSILILRYIPPDQVPVASSLQKFICPMSIRDSNNTLKITADSQDDVLGTSRGNSQQLQGDGGASHANILQSSILKSIGPVSIRDNNSTMEITADSQDEVLGTSRGNSQLLHGDDGASLADPLIPKDIHQVISVEHTRRRIAGWSIILVCTGVLLLTPALSAAYLPSLVRIFVGGIGGVLHLYGLVKLYMVDQDDARHSFGQTGGFLCPCVPLIPSLCIFVNVYLMINLGSGTWIRVSIWMVIGVFVYLFYGRTHSLLLNAVDAPTARGTEQREASPEQLA